MNPEFLRNLWLELSPRRVLLMTALLGLAFFAAAISGGKDYLPAAVAEFVYYVIVVVWGARNAALSVVGEIRDRTWDWQRLSALSAGEMTWGKLFGSTAYNWYGGALCLVVVLVYGFAKRGPAATLIDFVYYVTIGVIAQAGAMLASLIAVRRRQRHTRFEIFLYQLAGLAAAFAAFWVWETADPAGSIITHRPPTDFIAWWGQSFDARPFLLLSLAVFTGWTLVACYREMRRELKMRNGPLVWLGFLIFMGLYVAGFDVWLSRDPHMAGWSVGALRLLLAASMYAALTYIMVLLEPKDRVLYRWLGSQIAHGRLGVFLSNFQAWMMSYFAAVAVTVALLLWIGRHAGDGAQIQAVTAAGLGFLTRDVSIFVLYHAFSSRRRGDFGAVAILFALYVLLPEIAKGLGLQDALMFFYPRPTDPNWLAPAIAWGEAVAVFVFAFARVALVSAPQKARAVPA
jgi:hypothetical protein